VNHLIGRAQSNGFFNEDSDRREACGLRIRNSSTTKKDEPRCRLDEQNVMDVGELGHFAWLSSPNVTIISS
jgi:hypothetical protein